MAIKIPDLHVPILASMASLPKERLDALLGALRDAKPALYEDDLGEEVAKRSGFTSREVEDILTVLTSMYGHLEQHGESAAEFAGEVCDDLETAEKKPAAGDLKRFREYLPMLLTLDKSLGVTAKALDVMGEHQRTFCDARVFSDVRPIFSGDVRQDPAAAVVVHTLKIAYHEGKNTRGFYVALDSDDLEHLREVLERASDKEATLRRFLGQTKVPQLDAD